MRRPGDDFRVAPKKVRQANAPRAICDQKRKFPRSSILRGPFTERLVVPKVVSCTAVSMPDQATWLNALRNTPWRVKFISRYTGMTLVMARSVEIHGGSWIQSRLPMVPGVELGLMTWVFDSPLLA